MSVKNLTVYNELAADVVGKGKKINKTELGKKSKTFKDLPPKTKDQIVGLLVEADVVDQLDKLYPNGTIVKLVGDEALIAFDVKGLKVK